MCRYSLGNSISLNEILSFFHLYWLSTRPSSCINSNTCATTGKSSCFILNNLLNTLNLHGIQRLLKLHPTFIYFHLNIFYIATACGFFELWVCHLEIHYVDMLVVSCAGCLTRSDVLLPVRFPKQIAQNLHQCVNSERCTVPCQLFLVVRID